MVANRPIISSGKPGEQPAKVGVAGTIAEQQRTARTGELNAVSARIRRINRKIEELVESHFLSLRRCLASPSLPFD
jgi:hypothetical protein